MIDGRTPAAQRSDIVRQFQDGAIDCLIAGMDSVGEGITLTRADTCVFLEMGQKPNTMRQARDRLHRIGQKATVQAIYLVADNPLDRFFRDLCLEKADLSGKVLEEEVQVLAETRGEARAASVINDGAAPNSNDTSVAGNYPTAPDPLLTNVSNGDAPPIDDVALVVGGESEAIKKADDDIPAEKVKPCPRRRTNAQPAEGSDGPSISEACSVANNEPDAEALGSNADAIDREETVTNSGKWVRRAAAWEAAHRDTVRKQTALRVQRHRQKDQDKYREYMRQYMKKKRAADRQNKSTA